MELHAILKVLEKFRESEWQYLRSLRLTQVNTQT